MNAQFPANTLGYYHQFCTHLLGAESPATLWIRKQAEQSIGGFFQKVEKDPDDFLEHLNNLHTEAEHAAV